jgi:fumarate hydratase class II
MQDATPITLGQEWPGYARMLSDNLGRVDDALKYAYHLALGGTVMCNAGRSYGAYQAEIATTPVNTFATYRR